MFSLLCFNKFTLDSLNFLHIGCPVGWGCRIHQLQLCKGVRPHPQTSVLDMTLNNLMVRFKWCWSFEECREPLYSHRSEVHSGPVWLNRTKPRFFHYTDFAFKRRIYAKLNCLKIELFWYLNCVLMLNWTARNRTVLTFKTV